MTPEALMMTAAPALRYARLLLEAGDADGASNRAYYAMCDAARAALLTVGLDVGKTHKGVLNAFSNSFVRNGPLPKDTGRMLKQAETSRLIADYNGDPVEKEEARQLVEQADAFISTVSAKLLG